MCNGGSWEETKSSFVTGFVLGAGLTTIRYFVVGAKLVTLARFYVLSATASFIFNTTITIFAITQGLPELAVMSGVFAILAMAEWCYAYGNYLLVDVYGGNGRARLEIDPDGSEGENASLSNVEARKWYLEQEAKIPDLIDKNATLEQQARQAFELRNQFRTQARNMMADRKLAASLDLTDPNYTWEQMLQKQIDRGLFGDNMK